MTMGSDRFDQHESGGGSFIIGLLAGTVLGAGLGMLFAPKAGAELRGQLSDQANNLANQATDGYRRAGETAGYWAEKGRTAYDKARGAVVRGADEAKRYANDAADEVKRYASETTSEAERFGRDVSDRVSDSSRG